MKKQAGGVRSQVYEIGFAGKSLRLDFVNGMREVR